MRTTLFGFPLFLAVISAFGQATGDQSQKTPALYLQAPEPILPIVIEETRRNISSYQMKKIGWGITIKKEIADYIIGVGFENNNVTYAVFENKDGMLLDGGREVLASPSGWFDIIGKAVDAASAHWDAIASRPVVSPVAPAAGSATTADGSSVPGTVFIYRSDGRIYSPFNAGTIYCDGQALVRLNNHRFIGIHLMPGRRRLAIDMDTNVLELDIQPNKRYFVRCKSTPVTATIAYLKPIVQDAGEAILEIKKLKPEREKNIVDVDQVTMRLP